MNIENTLWANTVVATGIVLLTLAILKVKNFVSSTVTEALIEKVCINVLGCAPLVSFERQFEKPLSM